MLKYACVHFEPEEAEKQRQFLILMNNIRMITISREDIDEHFEHIKREGIASNNRIVLHDQKEVDRFTYAMDSFFKGKEYTLSDEPGTPEFADFVKRSEKKSEESAS